MKGLHLKLFRDFRTLGTQTFTIALLIIGGISVLVSSWSSYRSLQQAKQSFYEEFQFADIFAEVIRAPEVVVHKIAALPGIKKVESRIIKEGLVVLPNQAEPAVGRFISWRGDQQGINLIYLRQGRLPHIGPNIEIVVHESFAKTHNFKPGDSLEVLLSGKKRKLTISGIGLSPEYVAALSPVAPLPDDKHFGVFWMRSEDLESILGMTGAFNSLQIKIASDASLAELKRQIDQMLLPYGNIQSYDRSLQAGNAFVEDEIQEQRVMAVIVPAIFLCVAMFILNIMLTRMIALHRAQIATLKSLGYSALSLTLHYFQLVTLILLTGIVPSIFAGAAIGKWYASLYQEFFRFPAIDFSISASSVGLAVIAGLLPGWISAVGALAQVFSLKPAEALRPPSPPAFQFGIIEKLQSFRRLNNFTKMILRSVLFRPFRLLLSVFGMSAALAILIIGSFWTDVIDFMMDRQFREMRREDLTVQLVHPRDLEVLAEIRKIPGVLMVEGERSVPVRLRYRNVQKEMAVLGWQQDSSLSRIVTLDGKTIEAMDGGVLMSRYFETKYDLHVGDLVEFTQLQGPQKQFQVPILGFIDDIIGQQAYAKKSDLHRWLGESSVFDTLQIKINPEFAEKIYVELKEKPEVAVISMRRIFLKGFMDSFGGMILTFTYILSGFAVAIAGAVMYNSARVGFSERGWELASMRILGFGVKHTFELLFIEIGLQVLFALVPGLALGYWLSYLTTAFVQNERFKFPFVIDPSTYGAAVVTLIFTFLASSIFLFVKVYRMDFSEALKARE